MRVPPAQACQHKVLTARHTALAGFWPIPEGFRLEPGLTALPPRIAQPGLAFLPQASTVMRRGSPHTLSLHCSRLLRGCKPPGCLHVAGGAWSRRWLWGCQAMEPGVPANFPVDVLEVEPSPINGFMLDALRGGPPEALAWPVCSAATGDGGALREPFGFLRLSHGGAAVNLHLLPFNYPILFRRAPPRPAPAALHVPLLARRALPWRAGVQHDCSLLRSLNARLHAWRPASGATARHHAAALEDSSPW